MNVIKFYRVGDPHGNFSNFAPFPILVDNFVWRTTEHYFQASKFLDPDVQDKIRDIESPMEAAKEGRKKTYQLRADWEDVKDGIMLQALRRKFMQHPELQRELFLTGDSILIEHTKNDHYWADGGDGTGKNMLGILLMQLREELKENMKEPGFVFPPWIAFPGTELADMYWRMGDGESYIFEWYRYFTGTDQAAYRQKYPEAKYWKGFYDDDPEEAYD